ncbi:MAG: hypothetical protein QOH47_542 [Sphingomonadales bacterium]|jgi:hypothetical protein|nr:hypothetical protein [Sphingomonadales bacterium]
MVTLAPPPPVTIARGPPADPALDFDALKAEAIALVQHYAGEGWTDYNAHDPGVTIIEQLCYALTDLAYRAGFKAEDLLAGPGGVIARGRFGPHPPWRALTAPPVTVLDFRRLLLDRVPRLGNVWLTTRPIGTGSADGLYDIRILPETPLPGIHLKGQRRHERLVARVRRMFLRHRPLCEDIGSIRALRPLRTRVGAAVHLQPGARPEEVMAQAIYRLALALAPEPRRRELDSVAPGTAPAALFDGPLARNGLLAPGALADKPARIALDKLVERIADIPGVLGVREPWLWVDGAGDCADGSYAVADDHVCSLDAGIESDDFPLALSRGGQACAVDRDEVVRRLERLWERHRQRHPLKAAYRERFPMPQGKPREIAGFAPLAAQFPRVYGLGDGHDPPGDAAAGQLLGFLAIFEMLMVDYCDRLAGVRGLMAGDPDSDIRLDSSAFLERIPALHHLGVPPTEEDDDVFARLRMAPAQRERLLDFLLALYGEDAGEVPLPPPIRPGSQAASRHRIGIKHALLGSVARLARRRGRGFDYRAPSDAGRLAGVELRTRILLGDPDPEAGRGTRRRGLAFVEHMMLRPRTGERARFDDYRYGLAVSAVLRLRGPAATDGDYRRQVIAAIRAAVPAHIGLHVHFVDRRSWRRFRRLRRLWSLALSMDQIDAVDLLSIELRDLLSGWSEAGT